MGWRYVAISRDARLMRDSNPRWVLPHACFQDRCHKPYSANQPEFNVGLVTPDVTHTESGNKPNPWINVLVTGIEPV